MKELFPVVILAGGLATRLRPLTRTIPKALIEIDEEPFVAHQLQLLQRKNIRDVVMCVGYLGEQIQEYVGDGSRFGLRVKFVFDGPKLLGTAGAIKNALAFLPNNFFVLNGDSYLTCDYAAVQDAFLAQGTQALMTVFYNQGQWDTSNIEFESGKIVTYDKEHLNENMKYIDYGLEVFNRAVFEKITFGTVCDLQEIYKNLLAENQLGAFEVKERFYENGSFAGIAELKKYLKMTTA